MLGLSIRVSPDSMHERDLAWIPRLGQNTHPESSNGAMFVITRLGPMNRDFEEAVHALSRKMAEEEDPEKLELLNQQMRRLFLESDADSEEETPRGDSGNGS